MATTFTSREFNRDVSAAKRAAENGPVTITDHGRRSHVLLTAEEFDAWMKANGIRVAKGTAAVKSENK